MCQESEGAMAKTAADLAVPRPPIEDWRRYVHDDLPPILHGALACFVEKGFHGTSIRQIAQRSGLSVPGLYHHYESKHALLVAIMQDAMTDLWERTHMALDEAGDSVLRQLQLYIECLVLFHASRPAVASTTITETRSLNPQSRSHHISLRDRQHKALDDIVDAGIAQGLFGTVHPREATTAVITMCTGVSQWFNPAGELTPTEVAARYQHFATRMVDAA